MRRLGVHAEQSPRVREQYRCRIASFISVNYLSLTPGLVIDSHNENITPMSCFLQLSLAIVYFHYDLPNVFDIPLSKTAKFSSKAVCFKSTFLVLNPLQLVVEDFHTLFIVALSCYRSGFENGIHGK